MSWVTVAKPTSSVYTFINSPGREYYDESSVTYDDPSVFYDGFNPNAWTDVNKPTGGTTSLISAGFSIGLMIPLTISSVITIGEDPWTNVNKPTN